MKEISHFYEFENFQIDIENGVLLRDGSPVPLTPKALQMLLVLVQNAHRTLGTKELLLLVWPDTHVGGNNVSVCISAIRDALGDENRERYVAPI